MIATVAGDEKITCTILLNCKRKVTMSHKNQRKDSYSKTKIIRINVTLSGSICKPKWSQYEQGHVRWNTLEQINRCPEKHQGWTLTYNCLYCRTEDSRGQRMLLIMEETLESKLEVIQEENMKLAWVKWKYILHV